MLSYLSVRCKAVVLVLRLDYRRRCSYGSQTRSGRTTIQRQIDNGNRRPRSCEGRCSLSGRCKASLLAIGLVNDSFKLCSRVKSRMTLRVEFGKIVKVILLCCLHRMLTSLQGG